ncbi:MAG: hypothetical protein QXF12_04380 [Candidatus Aenigmatarchaeota archaeon]
MTFKVVTSFKNIYNSDIFEKDLSYIKIPITTVSFITFSLILAKIISEKYGISVILINAKTEKEKNSMFFLDNNIMYYTNEDPYFISNLLNIDLNRIINLEKNKIDYVLRCIKEDTILNSKNKLYVGAH